MRQKINTPVSVMIDFNCRQNIVRPIQIQWNNRDFKVEKIGMHYQFYEGKKLFHIFSITSEGMFFKLSLNTDNLFWNLEEVADEFS